MLRRYVQRTTHLTAAVVARCEAVADKGQISDGLWLIGDGFDNIITKLDNVSCILLLIPCNGGGQRQGDTVVRKGCFARFDGDCELGGVAAARLPLKLMRYIRLRCSIE